MLDQSGENAQTISNGGAAQLLSVRSEHSINTNPSKI